MVACLLCCALAFCPSNEGYADITVTVPNIRKAQGDIVIAIYDCDEKFPKIGMTYRTVRFPACATRAAFTIENVKYGECAFAIYHDENGDGRCNSNLFGIPYEGYGFSNNVKPRFSAPPYDACKISLPEHSDILIELIY